MKAWQKGYEIEELEHWVEKFKNFNSYNHNPFLQVKKFFLVKALEQGEIYEENNVVYMMRTAKASSKVNMFNAGPVIAKTQKGDTIISKIAANTKEFFDVVPVLDKIKAPAWLHLFEENKLKYSGIFYKHHCIIHQQQIYPTGTLCRIEYAIIVYFP